jgi:hypothetical protein
MPVIKFKNYAKYRAGKLVDELFPISGHSEFFITPHDYDAENDTIHMLVMPVMACNWAKTAYKFGRQKGMKYDSSNKTHPHGGQPRVMITEKNFWNVARFIGDFEDRSKVSFEIFSQQPSHYDAEKQLGQYYALWKVAHGLEPIDVFRKFAEYYD